MLILGSDEKLKFLDIFFFWNHNKCFVKGTLPEIWKPKKPASGSPKDKRAGSNKKGLVKVDSVHTY